MEIFHRNMDFFLDKRRETCYPFGEVSVMIKNVCKFIPEMVGMELRTVNFVLERDPEVQGREATAKHHRIVLISDGQGTFYLDGTPVEVSAGKLLFLFPGERCRAVGERLEYFYISFEGARAQDLFRRFGVTDVTRVFPGQEGMIPFWNENLSRATEDNIDIISECVLMYAFSRLTSVKETGGSVAYLMTTYAEENYADSDLSLQSLAEAWGYSPKYLSDCFKKRTGLGFSRYLKSLRIKHAVFYMDQGVESVKNVALLCGFQDPLYFSKVFRDTVGLSPREYISRRRAGSEE